MMLSDNFLSIMSSKCVNRKQSLYFFLFSHYSPNTKQTDKERICEYYFFNFFIIKGMSLVMRKPAFCICENKDADQLHSNCAADLHYCFRYKDTTIPLLSKSENSSLQLSSVAVQLGLCLTWSETPKTGFITTRLVCAYGELT